MRCEHQPKNKDQNILSGLFPRFMTHNVPPLSCNCTFCLPRAGHPSVRPCTVLHDRVCLSVYNGG